MNTPNPAPLATIGWLTITSQIDIMKMVFMWRILCLPINNIYRCVMLHVLQSGLDNTNYTNDLSPTMSMFKTVKFYNLTDELKKCMYADNQGLMPWYKRLIKRVVYDRETACWRATV